MAEKEEEGLLSLADSSNVKNKANKHFELWLEKMTKCRILITATREKLSFAVCFCS